MNKCFNCESTDINIIAEGTSGCSDAPKGKGLVSVKYWCYKCKGLYFFKFTSERDLSHEL